MSEAFARDELLPAVRANTSLRELVAATEKVAGEDDEQAALMLHEAEALVAVRSQPQ
jgi:hypothetical protein